ncbi:ABC transporter permease [Terrarubrum flagellatum]|uniref:ABC transporter permease n=1 Tax=Terrirubrum flagellatum TaxID=2895980 RepID=UPI0031455024
MNLGLPISLRAAAVAFVCLIIIFLLAPLVVVMAASLSAGGYLVFPPQGRSFRWYAEVLSDRRYQEALATSAWIAIIATAISAPLGTAAAIALTRFDFRGRAATQVLFLSPLFFPTIVVAIGLLIMASRALGGSSVGVIVAGHVALAIPFVVRAVGAVLEGVDRSTDEAARVMGARWWQRYLLVTLPQCSSGILAGALLAFLVSFDDAVLILFLRTPAIDTLPLRIYSSLEFSPDPGVAAASTLLIIMAAFIVLASERLLAGRRAIG